MTDSKKEKKDSKTKKVCKKALSKKSLKCILKAVTFLAILFALTVAFIYIPLQQLNLTQSQMQIESQRTDRVCTAQAQQQTMQAKEQAEKDGQEITEEQTNAYLAQQYSLCVYYAGYDIPQAENTTAQPTAPQNQPAAPQAENTETPE